MSALYYRANDCLFDNGDLAICQDSRYPFVLYAICELLEGQYYPLDGEFYSNEEVAKQAISVISEPLAPNHPTSLEVEADKAHILSRMRQENRAPYKALGMFQE